MDNGYEPRVVAGETGAQPVAGWDENAITAPAYAVRSRASLAFFGSGVAVGLITAMSMLAALSMMYP